MLYWIRVRRSRTEMGLVICDIRTDYRYRIWVVSHLHRVLWSDIHILYIVDVTVYFTLAVYYFVLYPTNIINMLVLLFCNVLIVLDSTVQQERWPLALRNERMEEAQTPKKRRSLNPESKGIQLEDRETESLKRCWIDHYVCRALAPYPINTSQRLAETSSATPSLNRPSQHSYSPQLGFLNFFLNFLLPSAQGLLVHCSKL